MAEDEIQSILLARRETLLAQTRHHDAESRTIRRERAADFADDEHDPEGSTLSANWQLIEGLRHADADELAAVDAALARLADGSFGRCLGCGQPIPAPRLQVRPTATRCLPCAR